MVIFFCLQKHRFFESFFSLFFVLKKCFFSCFPLYWCVFPKKPGFWGLWKPRFLCFRRVSPWEPFFGPFRVVFAVKWQFLTWTFLKPVFLIFVNFRCFWETHPYKGDFFIFEVFFVIFWKILLFFVKFLIACLWPLSLRFSRQFFISF